jgi:uncharacterized peroxidase-related enzyme
MAHIKLKEGIPGIRSLVLFRPETGKFLYELVEILLRGESPLATSERELIAAYVSSLNDCMFCKNSHAAAARCLFGENKNIVEDVLKNIEDAEISPKLKALLHIADKVRIMGKAVTESNIAAARQQGANDREIHDTVLIAATFCMFNRYVDGLASLTPDDPEAYAEMGKRMTEKGYVFPSSTT